MCNVDESFPVEKVRAIFDGALQRREAGGNLKGREGGGKEGGSGKTGKNVRKTARISLSLSLSLSSLSSWPLLALTSGLGVISTLSV